MEFESLIRNAVQLEMEQAKERVIGSVLEALKSVTLSCTTSFNHQIETSQGVDYQLLFANKLPSTIFTDSKVEAEKDGPIKIELVDTINKAIVTSGPLSSMKVQIVVLDGDLGFEDHENWTEQQFNAKVVKGKKDKRPLVIGDLVISLRDGVGMLSDLSFTDNSSWVKCRKFRLSARVLTSIGSRVRIKEAISNDFKVKEYRAKMYEKHYPPSLDDDVWRLKKVGKGGKYHRQLADQHIYKVKDFMHMYKTNPNKLKEVLNCTDRCWNTIVKHASTCGYDEKPNVIDGQNYQPPAKRICIQEPLGESKNDQAYEIMNSLDLVDGRAILGQSNDLTSLQAEPISTQTTGMGMGSYHASTSSSYKGRLEDHNHQLQLPAETNNHPIQPSDPTCGDYNTKMDGLQANCNEETVINLADGMTSQDPMSTYPSIRVQSSDHMCTDFNIRMNRLLVTEETVPSLAYGMTSQALMSTCPSVCIQSSDPIYGDYNIRMDGLLATEETVPSLAYGMTSQALMSTCPSVCIQSSDPICGDYNIRMDGLLATEETVPSLAYGMTSQALMSTCPSVCIQSSDPICGDYNIRMDGLLATEETVPNLAYGMTSQALMSTCPSVCIQSSDPICGDYNIRIDGLLATEETVLSLAYGMTSQAPMSSYAYDTLWNWEDDNVLDSSLISNDAEPRLAPIESPVYATSERNFFYIHIWSPGNE